MNRHNIIRIIASAMTILTLLISCGAGKQKATPEEEEQLAADIASISPFSADSAYSYIERQVEFGPRVPGTEAHRLCGDWLVSKLKSFGADVTEQTATLTTFDGTQIPMRNIFARINPEADLHILLVAHWDSRPWADNDPDPAKHTTPVDGANDGASGTAVILELARVINKETGPGLDILFCDAEDWGEENNDESWAMGARYFANNLPIDGYRPTISILLDMVGAPDATFMREYFSQQAHPALAAHVWDIAKTLGHEAMFPNRMGSAITDDHVELIKAGIPTIDIIDYREGSGFFSGWHTASDNMDGISKETLKAVGDVMELLTHTGIGIFR